MKLLLDENIPHGLRPLLMPMHDAVTFLDWSGVTNGTLLVLAASTGFDALTTTDKGIEYQQDLGNLPCSVVLLVASNNSLQALMPLVLRLLRGLADRP